VIIVCLALITIICFCCSSFSIYAVLTTTPTAVSQLSQTQTIPNPDIINTSPGITSTPITQSKPSVTPTETAEYSIVVPTETVEYTTVVPTKEKLSPTPTPTIENGLIFESAKIIDSPIKQVEKLLGKPHESLSLRINDAEEVPDGGEARSYLLGKYTVWVNYDKKGIAKGFQIDDGLLSDNYSLDQWGILLTRIGFGPVGLPDVEAPAARRWNDVNGYFIMIAANKIDGPVWTIRVYKVP
jgi:hypothetical protein